MSPQRITADEYRLLRDAAVILDRLAPTCAMNVRTWANRAKPEDFGASESAAVDPGGAP